MAQITEVTENEKQLRFYLHNEILNAKEAKVNGKTIAVHHLEDLHDITPFNIWKDDGFHKYEATAEFFFVPEDENGYISSGRRLNFNVIIKKSGYNFELEGVPFINEVINISKLKQIKNE